MKKLLAILFCVIVKQFLNAQIAEETDSLFGYKYNTIYLLHSDVSKPLEVDTISKITRGKLLLWTSAVVGIPIVGGLFALSLFPPSFVLIEQDGNIDRGIAFEFALGYSGNSSDKYKFSEARLVFQYSHLKALKKRFALAIVRDYSLKRFGRKDIFGSGFSFGAFYWRNFNRVNTVGLEFSLWIGNAMNVPYLFLFPQHHLFVKFRRGYEIKTGIRINEINIGFSSSITF